MITASCELLVEGVRVADTGADLLQAAPTALDGLQIHWGRATTTDQPETSTCSWQLRDRKGAGSFLDTLAVGRRVQVLSDVTVPSAPGSAGANVTVDPGYAALTPGTSAHGIRVTTASVPTTVTAAAAPHGNALSLDAAGYPYAYLTPAPCSATPGAWDQIPQLSAGASWSWSVDVYAPTQVTVSAQLCAIASPAPSATAQAQGLLVTRTGTGAWQTISGTVTVPAGGWATGWPGLKIVVHSTTWADIPAAPVLDATNRATYPVGPTSVAATAWTGVRVSTVANLGGYLQATVNDVLASPMAQRITRTNQRPSVPLGQPVTFSCDVRTTSGLPMGLAIYPYDAANVYLGAGAVSYYGTVTPANWTRLTLTLPAIPACGYVDLQAGLAGTAPRTLGQTFEMRNVQVQSGTTDLPFFDGATPPDASFNYRWTGAAQASPSERVTKGTGPTWNTAPGTWADYGPPVLVDNLSLRPPALTTRRVLVWAGRISDLVATPAADGYGVDVSATAVDFTADLANVYVGDQPWTAEPMGARFARILALVGPSAPTGTVDPSLAAYQVSWRDVDNQAAGDLLRDLATTVDGVLWAAAHITTGPRLWVEDPEGRAAVSTVTNVGGIWTITVAGSASGSEAVVTSCDLLADPVEWTQDTAEVITRVDATYLAQTLDAGQPAPTEAHVSVVDAPAEAALGVRRLGWTSQLTTSGDASGIAAAILARSRQVDWRISGLTWDTVLPEQPGTDAANAVANLLDGTLRLGLALVVTDLPPWSPSGGQAGVYVEGGTWTYTAGRWVLDMTVTPGAAQAAPMTWAQAPAGWTYATTDPAMSWRDLAAVGPATMREASR